LETTKREKFVRKIKRKKGRRKIGKKKKRKKEKRKITQIVQNFELDFVFEEVYHLKGPRVNLHYNHLMCMIVVVLDEHSQNFLQDQGRDQEDYQNWLFNDYSMCY